MKYLIFILFFWIVDVYAAPLGSDEFPIEWEEVAPGVWKGVVGEPETLTLLGAADSKPRQTELRAMGSIAFPAQLIKGTAASISDHKTNLRFPLVQGEQIYGLGLQFKTVKQRGTVKQLRVDHYGNSDNGRTHAPVPFYVSDQGYGVLINSARYLSVYAGTAVRKDSDNPPPEMDRNSQSDWNAQPYSDAVEIMVPALGTEVYVFAGKDAMEVVQRYNLFCGGGVLPPKWGLGFTHRTPTLFTDKEVLNEVEQFRTRGFPLSFIGLEPGWQSRSYPNTFVWDKLRFPHPEKFVGDLLNQGVRVNLWINPYISTESPIYSAIAPYTSSHTVWAGAVPDFFIPQVRSAYKQLFSEQHIDIGVSGYKVDEVDGWDRWLWPDVAKFPSGNSAEQMRQVYGLQFQKMLFDWYKEKNRRTYGMVRASNAGGSPLPFVIYNDNYSHQEFITALINSSFQGVLWTPEARSSKSADEWLRRMQTVCFSPMAILNAWADGTKPWSFPEVEEQVRSVMLLRMQLLPYLYTTFAQYYFEGKPPIRAMPLVEGFKVDLGAEKGQLNSTDNPYELSVQRDVKDQFMLGDHLLVAPIFEGEKERQVVLPRGKWYDFYSGDFVGEGEIIVVESNLGKIPLFVRDGGIIPMVPEMLTIPTKDEVVPLIIQHYGTSGNSWNLYDDDGETFDYEKGRYTITNLSVENKNGKLQGKVTKEKEGYDFSYDTITWKFMTN